jgi:uncharacterized protein (DUF924 family)
MGVRLLGAPAHLYRDDARAFAADGMALALAQEAVRVAADQAVPAARRQFVYMPCQHSESRRIHEIALALFEKLGDPQVLGLEVEYVLDAHRIDPREPLKELFD